MSNNRKRQYYKALSATNKTIIPSLIKYINFYRRDEINEAISSNFEITHYLFKNNYIASLVDGTFNYGNENAPFEVAVMSSVTDTLVYDTPITDDVLGYLTKKEAIRAIKDIRKLPKRLN